jgi:hypothetical protein
LLQTKRIFIEMATTTPYGTSLRAFPDMARNLAVTKSANQVLFQDLAMMLTGTLWYNPTYCWDLHQLEGQNIADVSAGHVKSRIEATLLQDPRVASVTATVDITIATESIEITILVEAETGDEFTMIGLISEGVLEGVVLQ